MLLRVASSLFALVFIGVGLAFWIAPGHVATLFRMELLSGAGLSTQIADLASFFMTLGGLMLSGLVSRNRAWSSAAIALLACAVSGRVIAWWFHGADLPIDMIAVEAVVITVLSLDLRTPDTRSKAESTVPQADAEPLPPAAPSAEHA